MTDAARQPDGRFGPGNVGNPHGRPSTARRMHLVIERELARLGATQEEIKNMVEAAGDPMRAASAIAMMVAAVAARTESNTPSPDPRKT